MLRRPPNSTRTHTLFPYATLFRSALIAGSIAFLFHSSPNDINNGIYSFNAVLCAITLAGYKRIDTLFVLLSIILSVLIQLGRSEEHTSELQSLMRISYAVFCLKKSKHT